MELENMIRPASITATRQETLGVNGTHGSTLCTGYALFFPKPTSENN